MRKVWIHNGYRDERIYLGGYEVFRRTVIATETIQDERQTLHIADDARRVCMAETLVVSGGTPVASPVPRLRYQLDDHLGTACVETDGDGLVISYEQYHPLGTSACQSFKSGVEVSAKRYRYVGKERDEETSLYHMGARYYAPWLGRWTACDPLWGADGVCAYEYCRGSPVNLVDPNGTQGQPAHDEEERRQAEAFMRGESPASVSLEPETIQGPGPGGLGLKGISDIPSAREPVESKFGHPYEYTAEASAPGFVKEYAKGAVPLPESPVEWATAATMAIAAPAITPVIILQAQLGIARGLPVMATSTDPAEIARATGQVSMGVFTLGTIGLGAAALSARAAAPVSPKSASGASARIGSEGGGRKLLALGRNRTAEDEPLLKPFADRIGGKRVLDIEHAPPEMGLPDEIMYRMQEADEIHFNLADLGNLRAVLKEGRRFHPGSSVRYTSWEFSQLIDNPELRAKAFFHLPDGTIVRGSDFHF